MNYFKPEDIKEYVSKNPTGIAGMSEELSEMVNHFAKQVIQECALIAFHNVVNLSSIADAEDVEANIKEHFGVEE